MMMTMIKRKHENDEYDQKKPQACVQKMMNKMKTKITKKMSMIKRNRGRVCKTHIFMAPPHQ